MKRLLLTGAVALSLCGCITTKVANSTVKEGKTTDLQVVHTLGFGEPVAKPNCPNGVASIAQGQTFGQSFVSSLSLGFYQPSTIRVACAK